MSQSPVATPGAPAAAPVPNDAWYLHGQGRRFGPLTEDDMRGYFRAGMVKGNDAVGVPGQVGTVAAAEAAALLGMPAPAPVVASTVPVAASMATSIRVTQTGTHTSGVLIALGLLVAIVGGLYFKFHVPASALGEAAPAAEVASTSDGAQAMPDRAPEPAAEWSPGSSSMLLGSAAAEPDAPATAAAVPAGAADISSNPAMQAPGSKAVRSPRDTWWAEAKQLWGNWDALRAHAVRWTSAEPRRDLAWWYLGAAHANGGDYPGAIVAYQQGMAVNPNHFKMRWGMANCLAKVGRYRESAELVQGLLRETPADARLWDDLGYAWAMLGEYDESVAALEKAVALDPRDRHAWSNLAWAYAKFGYPDKSRDATARANTHL